LRASLANAFLLGVLLDRRVTAQRAWDAAQHLEAPLGDREGSVVADVGLRRFAAVSTTIECWRVPAHIT
jgi:hypothetical protein